MGIVKIAITGGMGSGKSTVTDIIRHMGFFTLSSDELVSELYKKHKIKKEIKKMFPTAVKGLINLTIDRKELAKIIFSDKDSKEKLDLFIHPKVIDLAVERARKYAKGVVFFEVPVLFESHLEKRFDNVIVVMRDKAERMESVKERSRLTEEEITARFNNQLDYDHVDLSQYVVIYNDGNIKNLMEKTKETVNRIVKNSAGDLT